MDNLKLTEKLAEENLLFSWVLIFFFLIRYFIKKGFIS